MSAVDTYLANNAKYTATFTLAGLPAPPARKIAIVACMDARIDLRAALGLKDGEAHIIRNAGGVVTDDVIRSLMISQHLLGTVEIMLIHHTNCGLQTFTDAEIKEAIQKKAGVRPPFPTGAFEDLEDQVRRSIARVASSSFVAHKDSIRGFVYEVETGRMREVK
ncbi:MAG TPA: carbonic anhydrase [Gemmatimonadota bacterium]|nr:carbonic anhydrase [Gemmatimonadota bacterium]